jgi:hypothetical protein
VSAVRSVVRIEARTSAAPAPCPECRMVSGRVHSRYNRHLSDTAAAGREVLIRLTVRRLFCDVSESVVRTIRTAYAGVVRCSATSIHS